MERDGIAILTQGTASQCAAADSLVQKFTALRMGAVACVVLARVLKLLKESEGSNFIVRFIKAGLMFAEHEGLGMLLYFSVSFVLDSTTIFLAPTVGNYCEADKLAAIYSAALLTFLPNAFYALHLQEAYWDNATLYRRVCFVCGVLVLTSMSFYIRLKIVFSAGWIDVVQYILSDVAATTRAAVASAIPPAVDVIQSVILISVTHMKRRPTMSKILMDVEDGGYYAM